MISDVILANPVGISIYILKIIYGPINLKNMKKFIFLKSKGIMTLLLCTTWMLSSLTYAQVPTSCPIEIDGDPAGWEWVLPTSPMSQVYGSLYIKDSVNSSQDDQAAQQAKDVNDMDIWHWNLGNTNDKTDITNVGAAIVDDEGVLKLLFFGDRTAPNGDANIGFWLLLNGTSETCDDPDCNSGMFAPEHAVGDLLVLSNFLNGGGTPEFRVYQWDGTEPVEVVGTEYQSAVNDIQYPVPPYISPEGAEWTFLSKNGSTEYEVGLFFVGCIELTNLVNQIDLCNATVLFETRNSQSLTAQLGDLAGGKFDITPDPPVMVPAAACAEDGVATLTLCVDEPDDDLIYKWYDVDPEQNPSATPIYTDEECITVTLSATTTYWVTATNEAECSSDPAEVVGTVYPELFLTLTPTHVSCNGGSDGEIEATWTGGTGLFYIKLGFSGTWIDEVSSPYSFT